MIWPFSNKRPAHGTTSGGKPTMVFTPHGFFEMQCKYGDTQLEPKKALVAIVLDAKREFSTGVSVKEELDGTQIAAIKVVSDGGGFTIPAKTPTSKGDRLKPDDIVLWVPVHYDEDLASRSGNRMLGWIGLIVAKVKPEWDFDAQQFQFVCRYD